jgi:hypothetical protein
VKANPKLTVAALATFFAVAVPVMHAQAISPASLVQDGDTVGVHAFKNYAVWQSPLPPSFGARFLAQGTPEPWPHLENPRRHGDNARLAQRSRTMIACVRFSPEARGRSGAAIAAFEKT